LDSGPRSAQQPKRARTETKRKILQSPAPAQVSAQPSDQENRADNGTASPRCSVVDPTLRGVAGSCEVVVGATDDSQKLFLYECEHGCGYLGPFDEVCEHEKTCKAQQARAIISGDFMPTKDKADALADNKEEMKPQD
jgi:hypothetical protein